VRVDAIVCRGRYWNSKLLEAGSPLDSAMLPTGNDELDAVMRDWLKNNRGGHGN
jgi:hypothetical protein